MYCKYWKYENHVTWNHEKVSEVGEDIEQFEKNHGGFC